MSKAKMYGQFKNCVRNSDADRFHNHKAWSKQQSFVLPRKVVDPLRDHLESMDPEERFRQETMTDKDREVESMLLYLKNNGYKPFNL